MKLVPALCSCLLAASIASCTTTPRTTIADVAIVEAGAHRMQDQDPSALRARIGELERRLSTEQQARSDAESRARSLTQRVNDLEGQVLTLSLQRVRMEQELLRTRIEALKTEVGDGAERSPSEAGSKPTPVAPVPAVTSDVLERIRIPPRDRH